MLLFTKIDYDIKISEIQNEMTADYMINILLLNNLIS